jgi:hypothetical protein
MFCALVLYGVTRLALIQIVTIQGKAFTPKSLVEVIAGSS